MDLSEIKKLLELMESSKVVELEYEDEGRKVRLRRADERSAAPMAVYAPPLTVPVPSATPSPIPVPTSGTSPEGRPANYVEIKSPLVGTFYRAPKPDADPFVQVGDEVTPEKVICIIEAMKVMNEIKAEMHGVVREILVKNGQAVEFGELLFLIEKK